MESQTMKDILRVLNEVLTFEIFTIDNHGFSLQTLLTGFLLFVLGYWVCKRLARAVDQRLLGRLHIDQPTRVTLSRAVYYVFLVFWGLFTLRVLHVPLNIFTVLGGALAVGVGFGSQNLVSNFISGLMVLMERPLRVGDFIEVRGVSGFVERVGIRATRIRTPHNTRVIIPNKTFLEEFVTNFSISQGMMKSAVRFGVAYGTNVQQMIDLCMEIVLRHPQTLQDPSPGVFLVDFADNCLLFELSSWLNSHYVSDVNVYQSQLRLEILRAFEEHHIEIPFPQREVRLSMDRPLPVHVEERS